MKTAGLQLDFYDDASGQVLKKSFPTAESLPEMIKSAHILDSTELAVLRDEAFALVLVNEGHALRKFACVDKGNTALSVLYFLENRSRLPEEAQKVAAANLVDACEAFGLDTPDLLKEAAGGKSLLRKRDPMKQPYAGDEADWAQRTNLNSVAGKDGGVVMDTAATLKTAGVKNWAKAVGSVAKRAVKSRRVDVTGQHPTPHVEKKASTRHALGEKYPLDGWGDVQTAVNYFCENYQEMSLADRREFAVKTASRAYELGMDTPSLLDRYGAAGYADDVEAHIENRKRQAATEFTPVYDALLEKKASIDPDTFAQLLGEADEAAGLHWYYGGPVMDPVFATFGGMTEREKLASWRWSSADGTSVDAFQLQELAETGKEELSKHFEGYLVDGFVQEPQAIFESLPDAHKTIIARLANG